MELKARPVPCSIHGTRDAREVCPQCTLWFDAMEALAIERSLEMHTSKQESGGECVRSAYQDIRSYDVHKLIMLSNVCSLRRANQEYKFRRMKITTLR